jgi:hypothetical protein
MSSNALPRTNTRLFALGDDMSDGLNDYEASVGLKQNVKGDFDVDLNAAKAAELDLPKKENLENDALSARNVVNSNAKGFLFMAKRQLTDDFGTKPNDSWKTVGFAQGSTEVPADIPGRIKILDGAADYLKDNPGKEIATKNFTQAQARALSKALSDARGALNTAVGNRAKARTLLVTTVKTLRKRMSGLVEEIGQRLADDADEWYYFGLVPPAGAQTPGIPDAVNGHKVSATAALFAWAHAPRADKYWPFKQVIGVDAAPVVLKLTSENEILLEELSATATVKFSVESHNAAGDSTASEVVEVILV